MNRVDDKSAVCGFCGRSRAEVQRMIAGLTAQICDECVALSIDALASDRPSPEPMEPAPLEGRAAAAESLTRYAIDQALAGTAGAAMESDVRVLAAAALMYAGHFDLSAAASFAGLEPEEFKRQLDALGPPPPGMIRRSQPPPAY